MNSIHDRIRTQGRGVLSTATSKDERKAIQVAMAFLAEENTEAGFVHPSMCLTVLPHRPPVNNSAVWVRSAPHASLEVVPMQSRDGTFRGVPYGPKARLILLYLQAEAIRTGSPRVMLGNSMRQWLLSMGVKIGGTNYKAVAEQTRRIEQSVIRFECRTLEGSSQWQDHIIRGRLDPVEGDGAVILSEGFFSALREHPVPVSDSAIRHLSDTCMALDLYLWLAYRLHSLSRATLVSWHALQAQFGAGTAQVKHFKPRFVRDLRLAQSVYPAARIEVIESGVRLWPSDPAVAKQSHALLA